MRRYLNRQRGYGTKYVILPQAFGPFEESKLAEAFTDVANEATLLFARDDQSRKHLKDLRIDTPIFKAPDLTTIAPSDAPTWCKEESPYVCVVPNSRMIEEKGGGDEGAYVGFLSQVCERLDQEGAKVLFLLFEARDRRLLGPVCEVLGREVRYLEEEDPVRLRGIIGQAQAVVASRYHALVSALSQGIFALGTSWSHKYEGLFKDYGCADLIISDISNKKDVQEHIDVLVDSSARDEYTNRISTHAEDMKDRAVEMWKRVGGITGLKGIDQLNGKKGEYSPEKFSHSKN
jgi:colanic acid/amylovoran biosynthesis protein